MNVHYTIAAAVREHDQLRSGSAHGMPARGGTAPGALRVTPLCKCRSSARPAATPSRRTAGDARLCLPCSRANYAPSVDPQHKRGEDGAASLGDGQ